MKSLTQYLSLAIVLSIIMSVSALMTTYINNVYGSALSIKDELLNRAIVLSKLKLGRNKVIIIEFNRKAIIYNIIEFNPLTNYSYSLLAHIGNGTGQIRYNNGTIYYQNMTRFYDGVIGEEGSLMIIIVPIELYIKVYYSEGIYIA